MNTYTKTLILFVSLISICSCNMFEDRALNYKKQSSVKQIITTNKETKDNIKAKVLSALEVLEKGFNKQNVLGFRDMLDEFSPEGRIEVIQGNATTNSGRGWECDRVSLYNSIEEEVDYFDKIDLDTENTNVYSENNVAWFSTAGTVEYIGIKDKDYNKLLNEIKLELADGPDREINVIKYLIGFLSELLFVEKKGHDQYVLPVRLTGVLVKENGKWLFRQLAFSFPVDVKVLKNVSSL